MKHILLAVVGSAPQVMTETFWALRIDRRVPIDEVYIMTTAFGADICRQTLLNEGRFEAMLQELGISDPVGFDVDHILVFADETGNALSDIRTSRENAWARDAIFRWVENWAQDDQVTLHCSLAGGRKSMGFLLGAAVHFFGRSQDRLYHVLVSPSEAERSASFYFPTRETQPVCVRNRETGDEEPILVAGKPVTTADVRVELAEIPVCRLREVVQFVSPGQYDEETLALTQQAINQYAVQMHTRYVSEAAAGAANAFPEIVGRSPAVQEMKEQVRHYAPYNRSVLITGPTGSGKELVAAALHRASGRTGAFRSVNCATLGSTAESQLFGHEKGAFTGAVNRHFGFFEQADGGTLFLDEINSLLPEAQPMLLRAMEEGEIYRMGGEEPVKVDVRIVAAANEDLGAKSETGGFREDLLGRFALTIAVTALRDRREDIPFLAHHFLKCFSEVEGKALAGFTPDAMAALQAHAWPRNIRELKNAVDRAAILTPEGEWITPGALFDVGDMTELDALGETLDARMKRVEAALIREALAQCGGNITAAAKRLGSSRSKVSRKAKAYGIP